MKNLKKIVAVLLAVMLLGALAACGGDTKTDQPTSGGDSQQGGNQILETGLKQVAELESWCSLRLLESGQFYHQPQFLTRSYYGICCFLYYLSALL